MRDTGWLAYLLSCGLLIVPQTILLGMTFPLMSGAVIRRHCRHFCNA